MITTSYIDLTDAEIYFQGRLNSDPWDDSTETDKNKALVNATRRIDALYYAGNKADFSQELQFPRLGQTDVPDDVKAACCEIALKLLDGFDPTMEVNAIAAQTKGYSSVRTSYDRGFVLDHIRAGIPSLEAWQLLLPYMGGTKTVTLRRIS